MFKKYLKYKKKYLYLKAGSHNNEAKPNTQPKSLAEILSEYSKHLFNYPKEILIPDQLYSIEQIKNEFCRDHRLEKDSEIKCNSGEIKRPGIFYFLCNQYPFQYMEVTVVSYEDYCMLYHDQTYSEYCLNIWGQLTRIGYINGDVSSTDYPFTYNLITPEDILNQHNRKDGVYNIPNNGVGLKRYYAFTNKDTPCGPVWTDIQLTPSQWFIFFKPHNPNSTSVEDTQDNHASIENDNSSIYDKILQKILDLNVDLDPSQQSILQKLSKYKSPTTTILDTNDFLIKLIRLLPNTSFKNQIKCLIAIEKQIKTMKITQQDFFKQKHEKFLLIQKKHIKLKRKQLEENKKKLVDYLNTTQKKMKNIIQELKTILKPDSISGETITKVETQLLEQLLSFLSDTSTKFTNILSILDASNEVIDCSSIEHIKIEKFLVPYELEKKHQTVIDTIITETNNNLVTIKEMIETICDIKDTVNKPEKKDIIYEEYKNELYEQSCLTHEIYIIQKLHEIIKSVSQECKEITEISKFESLLEQVIENNKKKI